MHPDWNLIVTLVIFGIVNLLAMSRAYYGLLSSLATTRTDMQRALDMAERAFDTRMSEDRATNKEDVTKALAHTTEEIARIERIIDASTHRLHALETGSDEFTKSLRAQVHRLADNVQTLVLKVDRIENSSVFKGAAL